LSERGLTLTRLTSLSAHLAAHDWAWAHDNAETIERTWQRRIRETPAMFDGPVLLSQGCAIREDACEATFFETRFSRFLACREAGWPDGSVFNAFSAIVPHTADGAILLGEMGPHTANAGQIYFPCGTPDRDDLREAGIVDLSGSAGRELLEETGLTLPLEDAPAPWVLVRGGGRLAFLRPVRFAQSAVELVARIDAHRAREREPELARIVVVRAATDIDRQRMPGFVQAYLEDVLRSSV
jgi:8-oxo-dGTP pyrophosphatase MutT (NUDIX family)